MYRYLIQYIKNISPRPFSVAFFLSFFFFMIYFWISLTLSKTAAYNENDLLFGIDTVRVVDDMTVFSTNHYRTSVHPLYLLFVNPWGVLLKKIVGSKLLAALIINSFLGGFGVGMAFLFFYGYKKAIQHAVILASLFGVSASQLILSVIPDTATLAICSLLFTYLIFLLSLKHENTYHAIWIIAGVFSLGVTTTNVFQTFLAYTFMILILRSKKEWYNKALSVSGYGLSVITITILLALIRKRIYPSAELFYLPSSFQNELRFASLLIFQEPLAVLKQLVGNFLLVNVIAPYPDVFTLTDTFRYSPSITFSTSSNFSFLGWISFSIWVFLLSISLGKYQDNQKKRTLHIFFLLCFEFNIVLHSFYGVGERGLIEYFLYTGNFTFLSVGALANLPLRKNKYLVTLLVGLVLFTVGNNFFVLREIYFIYGR